MTTSYRERLSFLLDGTSEGAIKGWETRRRGESARDEKHAAIRKEYDAAQAAGASRDELRDIHIRAARASHGLPDMPPSRTISVDGREIAIVPNIYAERRGDALVPVDVDKFDENWKSDGGFYLDPHGSNRISNRYEKVGEYLKTASIMEAPEVSVRENGAVGFTDGRHRMAYLRDHGLKRVPVTMDAESLANAKKHGIVPAGTKHLSKFSEQLLFLLGGEGSGNFGHAGRIGEVGGSSTGDRAASMDAVRDRILRASGGKLSVLDLRLKASGDVELETIAVARGEAGGGVGTKAMEALTEWADDEGVRLLLSPSQKGYQPVEQGPKTTSADRLKSFYKRFGFVEPKGRHYDPTLSSPTKPTMYRTPKKKHLSDLSERKQELLALFTEALNLGGEGSGNFGHAGRIGEVGGSGPGDGAAVANGVRTFDGNEGYEWHERPEMAAYVENLPHDEASAVSGYASFGYGDINNMLRGTFTPRIVDEVVRDATPEEAASWKASGRGHDSEYPADDSTNKVEDGRIVRNWYYKDGYKPEGGNVQIENFVIEKAGPDLKYVKGLEATTDKVNTAIAEHGYALPEPMVVNRAAYIPGLSYDQLKEMEGQTIEEKGFTSTMLGNPSGRLDGYVTMGKSESLYKRYADTEGSDAIYKQQDEVGASMRIAIILPEGTKVAPVEAIRRTEYEFPRVPDVEGYAAYKQREPDGTIKQEHYTKRDYTAKPTVNTKNLTDPNERVRTRSEAEVLLGSGAQFRVVSVQRAPKRIVSSDPKMKPIDVIDVKLEYSGGGSSDPNPKKSLRHDLGGEGSGNFGHAGRIGEVGGSGPGGEAATKIAAAQRLLEDYQPTGQNERGVMVDAKTGKTLNDETGEEHAINSHFAPPEGVSVVDMHTHPNDSSFSDGDWKRFANGYMNIEEMRVVAKDHIYVIRKTPQWDAMDWKERTPRVIFDRWRAVEDIHTSPDKDWDPATVTHDINAQMAREFGVTFERRERKHAKKDLRHDLGGEGSGNFGHAGREGEVGGSASGPATASPQFKAWFKNSEVVDENGDPLRVYHGTTFDIAEFREAGAEGLNPESDWGAGIYFTSEPEDASENYAGEGPDLTNRIEQRAEQIEGQSDDAIDHKDAVEQARKELAGRSASVIPAYLSMQKPLVMGEPNGSSPSKETHFTMEYEYDNPDDPDSDIIGEKGTLPEFLGVLREVASEYESEYQPATTAVDHLSEHLSGDDYVSASRLHKIWKGSEITIEHPDTGSDMKSEIFRVALQRMGFDGVIDRTVDSKFGSNRKHGQKMKGINPDTTHFIAFNPKQIKSAIGNVGSFDPASGKIAMSYREKLQQFLLVGNEHSGNYGHAGRPGEVGGSAPGDPIDKKRGEFMALVKKGEDLEESLEGQRVEMLGAWQKWADDTKDRKKPLKPDGAAAKKLESYQKAKALETAYHKAYDENREAVRALNAEAREFLKVPEEDRSQLTFKANHDLHPALAREAHAALAEMRLFDGSGVFTPMVIPAEMADKYREVLGEETARELIKHPDGSVSLPHSMGVTKSETNRAYTTGFGPIRIGTGRELERQVWHEVAHHIEMNNHSVLRAAVELRESLADKPREVYKLHDTSALTGMDEMAVRGNFPDPYTARLYPNDAATEMVSTGVESYLANPAGFARERPEHFKFIFDVMHGKYANPMAKGKGKGK